MSWIFGSSARTENQFDLNYFKSIHSFSHFTYTNDHLYIAAGGNSRTCFYNQNENNSGWIACGVGLKSTEGTTQIYTSDNWTNLFCKDIFPDEEFNGHYAALKWNEGEIKLYTDILGLRDFYVAKTNKFIYFSTRIDWIAKVIDTEINLKSFGSRWLLYNQMSNESILTNIVRINRGTSALIKNGTIQIDQSKKSLLNNTLNENADYEFDNILNNFVNFSSESNKLVFALSGGLDSRLILSYLLKHKQGKFDTVTFGNAKHPDAVIPKSMADNPWWICTVKFEHGGKVSNRKFEVNDYY